MPEKKATQMSTTALKHIKSFWGALALLLCTVMLVACGTASAATLPKASKLPADGIVTKEQLATISGKTGNYSFSGTSNGINYTWKYNAAQIQNPTDQHLKLSLTSENLEEIKSQAANASYALAIKIEKFELAGSPTLTLNIPSKWQANRVLMVTEQGGKLEQLAEAKPKLTVTDELTTIRATMTVTHRTIYAVAGTTASEGNTAGSSASSDADAQSTPADSAEASKQSEAAGAGTSSSQQGTATENGTSAPQKKSSTSSDGSFTVSVSIDVRTLVGHLSEVSANKRAYVPASGWLLQSGKVSLKQGQSVYDALVSATKAHGIQMESEYTPIYSAYYIRGIGQLYEFDAGSLSGWMYSVDGWFPNYGVSSYKSLHQGSQISFRYTRDLGADLGTSARQQ